MPLNISRLANANESCLLKPISISGSCTLGTMTQGFVPCSVKLGVHKSHCETQGAEVFTAATSNWAVLWSNL